VAGEIVIDARGDEGLRHDEHQGRKRDRHERGERPKAARLVLQTVERRPGRDDQDQREANRGEEWPQHERAADREDCQDHQADRAFDAVLGFHYGPTRQAGQIAALGHPLLTSRPCMAACFRMP
jgi:hypothetical protein